MKYLNLKAATAIILTLVLSPALAAQETGSLVYAVSGNVSVTQGRNPAHQVLPKISFVDEA